MWNLKIEAARRQLGTALALFLNDSDPVSVHCLASAGSELAEACSEQAGERPFIDHIQDTFPDVHIKELRILQRQFSNAFKHYYKSSNGETRDDSRMLARFSDEQNDHILFIGWYDYGMAVSTLPIEAQIFQCWYFARYPEKVLQGTALENCRELFQRGSPCDRGEKKRQLTAAIRKFSKDSELMNDPKTDPRPLILPWITTAL